MSYNASTSSGVNPEEETLDSGRKNFQTFYENCNEAEDFYLSNFDFSVPETGSQVRLGTAHSTINTLVAHVTPQFLDISVPPPGPKGQVRAELRCIKQKKY